MPNEAVLLRMEEMLFVRYAAMCRALGSIVSTETIRYLFLRLASRYGEPHRRYHTLRHLAWCMLEFDRVRRELREPEVIVAAIFYHDAVYDVWRIDNEKKSAQYWEIVAKDMLGILDQSLIDRVSRLIAHTKDHEVKDISDHDARLFIDIDMSILGAEPETYDQYALDSREEYRSRIPDDRMWAEARLGFFLEPTLQRGFTFQTRAFASREARAIENLKRERYRHLATIK